MKRNNKGFTLLEIIIVIIIVGVLASLALPRFFATVEFARSNEALTNMSALRQSMERCYLAGGGTYAPASGSCDTPNLDISDPSNNPGTLFTFAIANQSATGYTITATRNTVSSGSTSSAITLTQAAGGVTRAGGPAFIGIK